MAKNKYPGTTLQPMQVLDFVLGENQRVRAVFLPQPDQTGTTVGHVALACIYADMDEQVPMPKQTLPQSITQAAELAFAFAQAEAKRFHAAITSARLQGQEFLERQDVEQITGNAFPVTVV